MYSLCVTVRFDCSVRSSGVARRWVAGGSETMSSGLFVDVSAFRGRDGDEPESLILAQSERWRHA